MKTLYPLHDIIVDTEFPIRIAEGVSVVLNTINCDSLDSVFLSKDDKSNIAYTSLCLEIDRDVIKPEEASIAFILACRLLKRTKVFARYRIDDSNKISKIRDDYPYVTSDDVTASIAKADFHTISRLYGGLINFKNINTRTGNATYFMSMAYRSRKWLEALIFHVCALETLISASSWEADITKKFKKRINNFISFDESKLGEIYNVRSELVHGRYSFESKQNNRRLNEIAEEVCRTVFAKILLKNEYIEAFRNENDRMRLFEN